MVCLYCQGQLSVSNSRPQKSRNQVWRRRPCEACGAVFSSIEALELSGALTVAYEARSAPTPNGLPAPPARLEPFDRDRLFISLYQSLLHRPAAIRDARGLADTVTARIAGLATGGQVSNRTIRQACLDCLQRFDRVAATHYAAFHS